MSGWRRYVDSRDIARADRVRASGHVAPQVQAAVWDAVSDPTHRVLFLSTLANIPARWHGATVRTYRANEARDGFWPAQRALYALGKQFQGARFDIASSDEALNEHAEKCAGGVVHWLSRLGINSSEGIMRELKAIAGREGVAPPDVETLKGMLARMSDAAWWRRALRKSIVRAIEGAAIKLGFVHRRASLYASAETVSRRGQQRRRNARTLAALTLENESGQAFNLGELSEVNISNPAIRRAELMTRMRGFQEYAEGRGHVSLFFTLTCPSRMHARMAQSAEQNPKYDGTTPRDAQAHMSRQWARARSRLDRLGIYPYGIRVAEPHHDGCPHWHLLLFVHPECVPGLVDTLRRYAFQIDGGELTSEAAQKARFDWKEIDTRNGGSGAAGYIAKYVAKNIDGFKVGLDDEGGGESRAETVGNVDAWAATWGIRQFQQIGGPGVTIWRELRRLRESPQLPLFEEFHGAADKGEWAAYVGLQGGIEIRRRDRPLALWKAHTDAPNRYGEERGAISEGVAMPLKMEHCRTRFHTWATPGEWAAHRGKHERQGGGTESGGGYGDDSSGFARGIWGDGAGFGGGGGIAGSGADSRGDHKSAAESPLDFDVAFPWSRVNNCTASAETDTYRQRAASRALASAMGAAHAALERIKGFIGSG